MGASAPRVGEPAPPLSGLLADGAPFDLGAVRGRAILIEFHRGTW